MLELLNIRFSFLCRTTRANEHGKNPILLRITFRTERRDIFTGLYCNNVDWNKKMSKVSANDKAATSINRNLDIILRKANDAFDGLRFSDQPFSIDELIDKIKGRESTPTLLIDFLEAGNKAVSKRVGVEITKATYYKYRKSLEYMQEFLLTEFKVKNFILSRVDTQFLEKYFYFLRTTKNVANNTAIKYVVFVKTIFKPAIRQGIFKSDPFLGLRLKHKPVHRQFLTSGELESLTDLELDDPDLDRKRDIFLFACYTGLAYTDLKGLRSQHIEPDADGTWYIRKSRQKTGEESIIPLLAPAIRILKKYSITGNIRDFKWYVSTNQKMNLGLKYITKRAGFSKVMHMHMARHTFATTVTLSNGVPIESVSKMLGHANIKQTQHYDMAQIQDLFK
jgi:site-specific recombinase XerD